MSAVSKISESYFAENNIRYVFLDGNTCTKIEQCYNTLQQQLSIPDYFGHNLDALEEVLRDLDWINEEKIRIILLNSEQLLSADKEKKKAFLDILNSCENEKVQVIYLGRYQNP